MSDRKPGEGGRSRSLYVYWGVALFLLLALGVFCWTAVAPVSRAEIGAIERAIDALTQEKAALIEDGAAGPSPFILDIDSIPSMKKLEAMGPKAVPVLISHLDDTRPTGLRGPTWGTRRVGDLCLQLLWRIAKVKNKKGAGHDLWFDTQDSQRKMTQTRRAWQREYYKPDSLLREENILENEVNPWM